MSVTLTPITTTDDLITNDRAIQNATLAALNTSNSDLLASLITAASDMIRQACHRQFNLASYTEYQNGPVFKDDPSAVVTPIRLREFPVTSISRVASYPRAALTLTNNSSSNQRATVATTATGINLVSIASAVTSSTTLSYSDHATIASLATAVNAVGGGWVATTESGLSLFPSADIRPLQGAMSAMNANAFLEIYTENINSWEGWDFSGIGWRLDGDSGQLYAIFPRGAMAVRIDYEAGFSIIPSPIQEACVQVAQSLYQIGLQDNTLSSEKIGPYSKTLSAKASSLSPSVMQLIGRYIAHDKVTQQ